MTPLAQAHFERVILCGDTILVHDVHEDAVGLVIEKFTHGTARHQICALGGLDIVEALTTGVARNNLQNYLTGKYVLTVKRLRKTLEPHEAAQARAHWLRAVGQAYGWGSCAQAAVTTIDRRYVRPWAPGPARAILWASRAFLGGSLPDCSALWVQGIRIPRPHVLGAYLPQEVTPEVTERDSHLTEVARFHKPVLLID